jgi:hypothetical protein
VGEGGAVDAPAQPVDTGERQAADMGEQMSRNAFNDCEREYNRREEEIEMAKYQRDEQGRPMTYWGGMKDQRPEAERVGSPQPKSNTQSSGHPTTADDLLRKILHEYTMGDISQKTVRAIRAHLSRKEV